MPAHWAPWPGKTNTTRPAPPAWTDPVTTPAPARPPLPRSAPPAAAPGSAPMTTARCSNTDRVAASDQPTSAGASPGCAATCAASRAAWAASAGRRPAREHPRHDARACQRRRPARRRSRRPAARLPGRGFLDDDVGVGAADAERGHPGPARPARWAATAPARCSSRTAPADQSTCGDGSSACRVARQHPVPQRQHHLDDPGHPGGGLGVPDVRLDRAEPQRPVRPGRSCP